MKPSGSAPLPYSGEIPPGFQFRYRIADRAGGIPRQLAHDGRQSLFLAGYLRKIGWGGRTRDPDIGATRLPFKVDTHLKIKLLMLLVIAAAVFLFIVEWVRVDVVAMAIMVLLPQLGLPNAKDTFTGLSSNAVVAIIGVMIISYGLNRAGLVNRIIQPLLKYVGTSSRRLTVIFPV